MVAYLAQAKQDFKEVPIIVLGFALPVVEGPVSRRYCMCDVVKETFSFSLKGCHELRFSTFSFDIPLVEGAGSILKKQSMHAAEWMEEKREACSPLYFSRSEG